MKKILFILLLFPFFLYAQNNQKILKIKRIEQAPTIDGLLNEDIWKDADKASDFIMLYPSLGDIEVENRKTIVKMLYDDNAIYIGAYLYDNEPEAIPKQFSTRDNRENADFFEVQINPYKDKQNDFVFYVSISGTQSDCKVVSGDHDFNWNAVWESDVSITDKGWFVEMKIPYAALRFSKEKIQDWDINFIRNIRNTREEYSWNFIDRENGRESEYPGLLKGLSNIKPPIRLSFHPFAQGLVSNYDGETSWKGTAGLDVKYGINESFTLDATLVPDFGQTAFDDIVLNLGPFEQQYEEKRAFFTEGTELFSKGNLLYTRRIGATPVFYGAVNNVISENEEIINNPEKTKMLNAIKISGRTKNGLGLGFFNAITNTSYATIRNKATQTEREYLTSPLTNYNLFIIDKTLPRSSSISFVNSNVMRKSGYTDANVSSLLIDYKLKNNKYVINTDFSMSNRFTGLKNNTEIETGYSGNIRLKEVLGSHRFMTGVDFIDKTYNKNDLGYQEYNNYVRYNFSHYYRTYKPIGIFNSIFIGTQALVEYMQSPYTYTDNIIISNFRFTTKKHLSYGLNINATFGDKYDYYEAQESGRYIKEKMAQYAGMYISTDYRKKFAIDTNVFLGHQFQNYKPHTYLSAGVSPRYRVNNRLQFIYRYNWNDLINKRGYINHLDDGTILFGNRRMQVFENSLNTTYNISTKSAITLTSRNYWVNVSYDTQLYSLEENGTLVNSAQTSDYNGKENIWNFDISYAWEFAPGSQLIALYRNGLYNDNQIRDIHYLDVSQIFDENASNSFSLKLIYYLDYNKMKKWL